MSGLIVDGLVVELGGAPVLRGIDFDVTDGAFAVIVGPSGCGKSTLLRAIAGLRRPIAGRISVGGDVLSAPGTFVAPERRGVGWVPQDASLFPHLTVAQNVAFGAAGARGGTGALVAARARADRRDGTTIAALLELTGLSALAGRYPDQLSGGQAQRVALARALAASPRLLLLDEPFAALDPRLRAELREEVRSMLRRLGVTGILVTHDQAEALLVADTVLVMREGRVEQQGTPSDVYRRPASPWSATFLGEAVFVEGAAHGGRASTALGPVEVAPEAVGTVAVMLRPEQLALGDGGSDVVVTRVRYGGHDALVELAAGDGRALLARVHAGGIPQVGDRTTVRVRGRGVVYEIGSVSGLGDLF